MTAAAPRVAWSLDCAPSIKTADGSRYSILVAVDDFTRYTLCIELPRLDSNSVKRLSWKGLWGPMGAHSASEATKAENLKEALQMS